MNKIHVTTRSRWRQWLAGNHDRVKDGVWLIFQKKSSSRPTLDYEEAVEEALCYGWIDSLIRRIDDHAYCRKFTPRKNDSAWSNENKRRVKKLIKEGKMTEFGRAKVDLAKKSGRWAVDPQPVIAMDLPPELAEAFGRNKGAKDYFQTLAPTYRKQFIGWIAMAKRPATRVIRVRESITLLAHGRKLGLK